jgi:hypothetical protein
MNPAGICFINRIHADSKTAHISIVEQLDGTLGIRITMKDGAKSIGEINLTSTEAINIGSNLEFLGSLVKGYEEEQH